MFKHSIHSISVPPLLSTLVSISFSVSVSLSPIPLLLSSPLHINPWSLTDSQWVGSHRLTSWRQYARDISSGQNERDYFPECLFPGGSIGIKPTIKMNHHNVYVVFRSLILESVWNSRSNKHYKHCINCSFPLFS